MDKTTVESMRVYLEAALTGFEEHFGVQVSVGNISYSYNNCRIKMDVAEIKEDGSVSTREADNFKRLANSYGLESNWLGQEFTSGKDVFVLTGLNTRARKFPVQATRKRDGKKYKFPVSRIQRAFSLPIT